MYLHELKVTKKKTRKRLGRGNSSGHGTYSGRGIKGQGARKSSSKGRLFEGGQTPLARKMPKLKGFKNPTKKTYRVINLETLEKYFKDGEKVNKETLLAKKIIKKTDEHIKILGKGTLTKKLIIELKTSKKVASLQ